VSNSRKARGFLAKTPQTQIHAGGWRVLFSKNIRSLLNKCWGEGVRAILDRWIHAWRYRLDRLWRNWYTAKSVGSRINDCDLIIQDPPDYHTISDLRWWIHPGDTLYPDLIRATHREIEGPPCFFPIPRPDPVTRPRQAVDSSPAQRPIAPIRITQP
jgi:hypothetical protein